METDNYEQYLEYIGAGKMTVNFTHFIQIQDKIIDGINTIQYNIVKGIDYKMYSKDREC